jgi:hypothetical protein
MKQPACHRVLIIVCLGMLLATSATRAADPVGARGMLSTGEEFAGRITHCDATRLTVLQDGRPKILLRRNVVRMALEFSEADQKTLDAMDEQERPFGMAGLLLENHLPDLAEALLVRRLEGYDRFLAEKAKDPKQREEAVKARAAFLDRAGAVFLEAKTRLPAALGGEGVEKKPEPQRYVPPSPQQIAFQEKTAEEWFEAMKKIAPEAHLIETDHYRIYSAWAKSDDGALKKIYANLYKKLCEQFDVPEDENIWIGKLPIYAFWTKLQFTTFSVQVAKTSQEMADNAGGYAGWRSRGGQVHRYVVLGPVKTDFRSKAKARAWFFELLTHESSHAFMGRYINERPIPNWVDEGIADTMAATLVPGSWATRKHVDATKEALAGKSVNGIFDCQNIPMDTFHYGIAQSMVRYLIAKDRKAFIEFIRLMKEGKKEADALRESYDMTRDEMVRGWGHYAKKKYR